jgi:hypothetical protein
MPETSARVRTEDSNRVKAAADERQQEFERQKTALMDDYFAGRITVDAYGEALARITQEVQGDPGTSGMDDTTAVGGDGDSSVKTTDAVDDDSSGEDSDIKDAQTAAALPPIRVRPLVKRKRDEDAGLNQVSGKVRLHSLLSS